MWVRFGFILAVSIFAVVSAYDDYYSSQDENIFNGNEVANIIRGLIEPLAREYPLGILGGKDVEIGPDGHAFFRDLPSVGPVEPAINVDPSKLDPSMLNTKRGLSPDCNNKLCYFYEYALSCKAIGLNMTKICAQYFMGRILGCSVFPPPSQFYNAPSICLPELGAVAKALSAGVSPTSGVVGKLLKSNFTVNCHRNCYQNFLNAGISFYETCTNEINATHPISVALASFNTFRQQACVTNYQGQHCFSSLYALTAGTPVVNIFDQYCNYLGSSYFNSLVLNGVCSQLSQFGCCYANQVAMLAQDQSNASALRFFPACLLNYMTQSCPTVQNSVPCTAGLGGNMSFIKGSGSIATSPCGSTYDIHCLPNLYSKNSTLVLQGVLIGALAALGYTTQELANMHLRATAPFNVEILKFTYYNSSGSLANKQYPGVPPTTAGLEYHFATKVEFDFQFAIMGLNATETETLYSKLLAGQAQYSFGVKSQYGVPRKGLATVVMTISQPPNFYLADPIITHKNSASSNFGSSVKILITVFFAGFLSLVLQLA